MSQSPPTLQQSKFSSPKQNNQPLKNKSQFNTLKPYKDVGLESSSKKRKNSRIGMGVKRNIESHPTHLQAPQKSNPSLSFDQNNKPPRILNTNSAQNSSRMTNFLNKTNQSDIQSSTNQSKSSLNATSSVIKQQQQIQSKSSQSKILTTKDKFSIFTQKHVKTAT